MKKSADGITYGFSGCCPKAGRGALPTYLLFVEKGVWSKRGSDSRTKRHLHVAERDGEKTSLYLASVQSRGVWGGTLGKFEDT